MFQITLQAMNCVKLLAEDVAWKNDTNFNQSYVVPDYELIHCTFQDDDCIDATE